MSLCVIRTRPATGVVSWSLCSRWQHNALENHRLRLKLPYSLKNYFKTSSWHQSRWPGRKYQINPVESNVEDNYSMRRLWRPFMFSITVSGVSMAGAAIWQYENVRAQATQAKKWWSHHTPKYGQFRQHMHKWWEHLSVGDKTFVPICAANVLVFLAWLVPAYKPFMTRYFTASLKSNALCWPMLLSVFSHYSLLHLAANMFVLHSFTEQAVSALGKEQFVGLYLSAGVISSFTSYLYKALMKTPTSSLGASGAVMCVLAYVCSRNPHSHLAVIILPQFPFEASTGLKALLCMDFAGCIFKWSYLDHAAHLGGSLFGMAWYYWGHQYIWRKREPLVSVWHKIRGPVQ